MTPEEYTWTINLVKDRNQYLHLSYEQAEKIYEFEKMRDQQSGDNFFSAWEEFDFTQDTYQKILNEKQFKNYIKYHRENIKRYEQHLIESDIKLVTSIQYHEALIDFYKTKYIPGFYEEKFLFDTIILSEHQAKISFIKEEYKISLAHERTKQISTHYRYNRLFRPYELKVAMLRHQLLEIVPNYSFFKTTFGKPMQATADFLLEKFRHIPGYHSKFFETKRKELETFSKRIQKKYLGDPKGWHTITRTELQIKDQQIMQVILLSPERISSTNKDK